MLFLVVGTPWKMPRSNCLNCPGCGVGWFGGMSSTKTATLRMRVRNSCGSESSSSSTTFTNCCRFIIHLLTRSLRVAVVSIVGIFIFLAVAFVFLFVFFLIWLLSKDAIGNTIRRV